MTPRSDANQTRGSWHYNPKTHLGLIALLVLALFIKNSPLFLAGQLVSEDSFYFYPTAYNHALPEAIATPYAGYLHVLPMLIAELLWLVPFEILPWANSLVALTLNAFLLSWLYSPYCRRLIASDGLRMATVVFLALTPFQPNLGMLLGLHWYLAFFLGIFLIGDLPKGRKSVALASCFVTLAAWSTPAAICLIPVGFYSWWRERHNRCRYIPFCFAVASLAYATAILFVYKPASAQPGLADPLVAVRATLFMMSEGVLFQTITGVKVAALFPPVVSGLLKVLLAGGVLTALWKQRHKAPARHALTLLLLGIAILGLTMLRGHQSRLILQEDGLASERYLTTPVFYFWTAVSILIAPHLERLARRGSVPRLASLIAGGLLLLAMIWEAPPLHGDLPLSRAFPHASKAAVLRAFEERYEFGGQAETLALPGWTPIECMRLKVGGGRTCRHPEKLECIFGQDLQQKASGDFHVDWFGNFTAIGPDWVLHEAWGRVAIIGYSGGFYWFRDPSGQTFLSGPAIYPRRFKYPFEGFVRVSND